MQIEVIKLENKNLKYKWIVAVWHKRAECGEEIIHSKNWNSLKVSNKLPHWSYSTWSSRSQQSSLFMHTEMTRPSRQRDPGRTGEEARRENAGRRGEWEKSAVMYGEKISAKRNGRFGNREWLSGCKRRKWEGRKNASSKGEAKRAREAKWRGKWRAECETTFFCKFINIM